jgi:hypothetical protein
MFSSVPLHNSTSILLILNSLDGFRGKSISFKKREQKAQGFRSGLRDGENCHNFNDPVRRVGQKQCSRSPARRFQYASHILLRLFVCLCEAPISGCTAACRLIVHTPCVFNVLTFTVRRLQITTTLEILAAKCRTCWARNFC